MPTPSCVPVGEVIRRGARSAHGFQTRRTPCLQTLTPSGVADYGTRPSRLTAKSAKSIFTHSNLCGSSDDRAFATPLKRRHFSSQCTSPLGFCSSFGARHILGITSSREHDLDHQYPEYHGVQGACYSGSSHPLTHSPTGQIAPSCCSHAPGPRRWLALYMPLHLVRL